MRRIMDFTLVELLFVVGIIIIMMGFTVPIFSRISTANSVDGATRMVSTQLSLARMNAITSRQYVAVVLPAGNLVPPDGDADLQTYPYQSMRLAVVKPGSDANTFEFQSWYEGADWSFLPKGAVIAEADADAEETEKTSGVECTMTISKENNDYYGEVMSRSINDNWLGDDKTLGQDSGLSVVKESSKTMVSGQTQPSAGIRAIVFTPKGHVAGGTKYVTIVEGTPQKSGDEYRLINGNIYNMRLLQVGQYAGKVVLLEPEFALTQTP